MIKEKCLTCDIKSAAVGHLDESQLRILGENCAEASFKKGEVIIKQDSLSSNIIYLKDGLVKTSMEWNHKNQILNIIKAPAYLGIPTTLVDKVNHYSVSALEFTHTFIKPLRVFPDYDKIHIFGFFILKRAEFRII